jgi:hypothetical protein
MTRRPDNLQASNAQAAMDAGVTRAQLEDAAAVAALFNIVTRYADALGFAHILPTALREAADARDRVLVQPN